MKNCQATKFAYSFDEKNSAEMSPDRYLAASGLVFSSPCEKSEQISVAKIHYIK